MQGSTSSTAPSAAPRAPTKRKLLVPGLAEPRTDERRTSALAAPPATIQPAAVRNLLVPPAATPVAGLAWRPQGGWTLPSGAALQTQAVNVSFLQREKALAELCKAKNECIHQAVTNTLRRIKAAEAESAHSDAMR